MRRASILWLSAALAVVLASAPAEAKRVRAFAMGPKLDMAWMESRQAYRDKLFALADKRLRGPGKPLIQTGVDDFASHLLGPTDPRRPVETARDLVLWPESVGLFPAFSGERGAPSRLATDSLGAFAALFGTYASQIAYYTQRYPDLAGRQPGGRALLLALTDTYGRVVVETFAEMADRYDVWLEAGVDMTQDWRVVCRDRKAFNEASPPRLPGAVLCEEENADKVQQLGDPFEPERDYAYEATTPRPSVMALFFDPDGRLVAKRVKSYTVLLELGNAEGQIALDMVPGEVSDSDARPVQTSVGTIGTLTSKPAWMPDIVTKLDQQHADLIVQPEFFLGNLVQPEGMWNPDVLTASGYNNLLRHPSFESFVNPEMTGGLLDLYADHQQHIAVKPRRSNSPGGFLVGQPEAPGLVKVAPWVVPDPIRPDEPFAERRTRLGEAGQKLMPGSGVRCPDPAQPGPCERGHVENVLFHDVVVDRTPRYRRFRGPRAATRFSRSRPARPSRSPQRNAAVAMRGRRGVLAYEEHRRRRDQVLLVRTADGGRTWSRSVRPTGRQRLSTDEWWPSVAVGQGGRVTVAWVDRSSGRERVYYSRSRNWGRTFGPPSALDPAPPPDVAQWRPTLAAGRGDLVHAAFVDERARSADDNLPQAGTFYTRIRGGRVERARRLDTDKPVASSAKLDNAWAPHVAAAGDRVIVTWLDFQHYDWDVFARVSANDGESFGAQTSVNNTPEVKPGVSSEQDEALNDTPRATFTSKGPLVAWTDWRKRDETARTPHSAYDIYVASPGATENYQADPYGGRQLSTFWPAVCAVREDVLVAFQDASRGQNDVRIVRMRGGSERGRAYRVDDAGRRGGNAWRPQLACSRGRVLAAWEDERDGPPRIYTAVAPAGRL